jgi:hypothetical protein
MTGEEEMWKTEKNGISSSIETETETRHDKDIEKGA